MTRRAAPEWDVAAATVAVDDVDARLRAGVGRTGQLQVLIDHDAPGGGRCPRCGWTAPTSRRDCPSRVIAKALLDRKPLPSWLAHLGPAVPGARVRETALTREQRRAAEDELPGLFAAPTRQPDRQADRQAEQWR